MVEHILKQSPNGAKKARNIRIVEMYIEENMLADEIAETFGITHQRVQQILKACIGKEPLRKFVKENSSLRIKKRLENLPTIACPFCGKKFKKMLPGMTFCSKKCYLSQLTKLKNDPVLIAERKKHRIASIKQWQRENRDKIAIYNKRTWKKIKAEDPERVKEYARRERVRGIKKYGSEKAYKKYLSEKTRMYYNRKKEEPGYREKMQEREKIRVEKLRRENPEKYEELKERRRQNSKKDYQKKKELCKKQDLFYKEKESSIFLTP